jgi:hypothetical protein
MGFPPMTAKQKEAMEKERDRSMASLMAHLHPPQRLAGPHNGRKKKAM